MFSAVQVSLAVASSLLATGCSFTYIDSKNMRHTVGFVDVAVPAGDSASATPSAVSVTSVGMRVYNGAPNGGGIVLGYSKETVLLMPSNSCVDLNAPGICATTSTTDQASRGTVQR